jgi:hypothetical protein
MHFTTAQRLLIPHPTVIEAVTVIILSSAVQMLRRH